MGWRCDRRDGGGRLVYTTLSRVLSEDKGNDTGALAPTAPNITAIFAAIQKVTRHLKQISWDFEPRYGTELFTACAEYVNVGWGLLTLVNPKGEQFLLASPTDVPTVVSGGQTLTFDTTSASVPQVMPYPQNYTPIKTLRLNDANNAIAMTWYPTILPLVESISVTGWWGYRHDYANAFVSSGQTVQDNPLSASATTMNVTSTTGPDALFWAPCLDAGNLIRIDNELILVLATTATTLSVRRGVNGTTAASHNQGAAINVWYPEDDVQNTVSRQAAYFYARRGAYETVSVSGIATAVYPPDMVDELWAMLQGYQNE